MPPHTDSTLDSVVPRRLVVVGLGRIGVGYAMAIAGHPGCTLAGLVDARADRRAFVRGAGFQAPRAANLAALFEREQADAVVLAGALAERPEALDQAVNTGLPVLADRGLASDAAGAERAAEALRRATASVRVGYAPLLHPLFERARVGLAAGALGRLHRVQGSAHVARVFSSAGRPSGQDVLGHIGPEALALLDSLTGGWTVRAVRSHALYGPGPDEVHARLVGEHGAEGAVDLSWSMPEYPRTALVLEAEGPNGHLLVSDDALEWKLEQAAGGLPADETRVTEAAWQDPAPFDSGEPSRVLAAFLHALEGSTAHDDALDPARALRVARLLSGLRDAAQASPEEVRA